MKMVQFFITNMVTTLIDATQCFNFSNSLSFFVKSFSSGYLNRHSYLDHIQLYSMNTNELRRDETSLDIYNNWPINQP